MISRPQGLLAFRRITKRTDLQLLLSRQQVSALSVPASVGRIGLNVMERDFF